MSIEQDLRAQLTAAIKAKDLRTANVIRMINTKVMERRTAKGFKGEVDDALYTDVIAAYKKSLDKAQKSYEGGGEKGEQAIADLKWESEFCSRFLPKGLDTEAVRAAVREAIAEIGAKDPKMAGRVVGAVMKTHKGLVDPAQVKAIATEELSK